MSDATPDDVRAAILRAADALATIPETSPHNVRIPLALAEFKLRAAMVQLADAVRTPECPECGAIGRETFTSDLDICLGCGDLLPGI